MSSGETCPHCAFCRVVWTLHWCCGAKTSFHIQNKYQCWLWTGLQPILAESTFCNYWWSEQIITTDPSRRGKIKPDIVQVCAVKHDSVTQCAQHHDLETEETTSTSHSSSSLHPCLHSVMSRNIFREADVALLMCCFILKPLIWHPWSWKGRVWADPPTVHTLSPQSFFLHSSIPCGAVSRVMSEWLDANVMQTFYAGLSSTAMHSLSEACCQRPVSPSSPFVPAPICP